MVTAVERIDERLVAGDRPSSWHPARAMFILVTSCLLLVVCCSLANSVSQTSSKGSHLRLRCASSYARQQRAASHLNSRYIKPSRANKQKALFKDEVKNLNVPKVVVIESSGSNPAEEGLEEDEATQEQQQQQQQAGDEGYDELANLETETSEMERRWSRKLVRRDTSFSGESERNIPELLGELVRVVTGNQRQPPLPLPPARSTNGSTTIKQAISSSSGLAAALVRQTSVDLPTNLANASQFLLSLLGLLTVNNPLIVNSPRLARLRNSTSAGQQQQQQGAILDEILRLLRTHLARKVNHATGQGPRAQEGGGVAGSEPLAPALPAEEESARVEFVRRLNELTARSMSAGRRRTKRSVGSLLMLSPFSKLYAAMWFHRVLRQQSNALTQVLMGELMRRFVIPLVLPNERGFVQSASELMSPTTASGGGGGIIQRTLSNRTNSRAKTSSGEREREQERGVKANDEHEEEEECLEYDDGGPNEMRRLVGGSLARPLISVNPHGLSVQLPAALGRPAGSQLSVPHPSPELFHLLYRTLERAPVLGQERPLQSELQQQQVQEQLWRPLSAPISGQLKPGAMIMPASGATANAAPPPRDAQISLSANNASSLMDMIGRLAAANSTWPTSSSSSWSGGHFGTRKTEPTRTTTTTAASTPAVDQLDVLRELEREVAKRLSVAKLANLLNSSSMASLAATGLVSAGNASSLAGSTTNVLNLRVHQVAGDQVLQGGSSSSSSSGKREPGSNRANGLGALPRSRPAKAKSAPLDSGAAPLPVAPTRLSNHRMAPANEPSLAKVDLKSAVSSSNTSYLYQPLATNRESEREDAARWNDVLSQLGHNLAAG